MAIDQILPASEHCRCAAGVAVHAAWLTMIKRQDGRNGPKTSRKPFQRKQRGAIMLAPSTTRPFVGTVRSKPRRKQDAQVLTALQSDVEWAAHPGRKVPGVSLETVAGEKIFDS
ncbi:MAG: hypothetical protein ABI287_11985, partial [Rhodanobacter sp.]